MLTYGKTKLCKLVLVTWAKEFGKQGSAPCFKANQGSANGGGVICCCGLDWGGAQVFFNEQLPEVALTQTQVLLSWAVVTQSRS